ncbi:MAG TPA: alpha/beta hydrolase, partial [Brevundimonas sp.]|nr:alpha/beta hydrolase [Brevundimonas sp.]
MTKADVFIANGRSRTLIVMVHGMGRGPSDFGPLIDALRSWSPDADVFAPALPLGVFSMERASDIATSLAAAVTRKVDGGGYDDVVLVGHSLGALILRAAWMQANGVGPDGGVDLSRRLPWAARVRRIVLLAALGRGWRPTIAMSPQMRAVFWATTVWEYAQILPRLLPFEHRRGAAFLTMVRLQSLELDRAAEAAGMALPPVVQLLGAIDDLVAPADNIDLITGAAFQYVEVEQTGHLNVVAPDADARRGALHFALTGDHPVPRPGGYVMRTATEVADLFSDAEEDFDQVMVDDRRSVRSDVDMAVMVVHGIRDYGYWTKRLAGVIKRKAEVAGRRCRTVTSSYGFFPMGPFVSPAGRRKRVEWFMDQYVQARSLYPDAAISFVGHSNGTYLLAGALRACEAVRFDKVVFAGSVVRTNYEWDQAFARKQVARVVNYVATGDWVVAGFPKFLGRFRVFDLGGAGTDGFRAESGVENVRYVKGAHDAAIVQANWDGIADFVVAGRDPAEATPTALLRKTGPGLGWEV